MLAIKRKKILTIIISIIMIVLFGIASILILNQSIKSEKSYSIKLIDIIDKDEESLLNEEELEDYELKIEEELKAELNGNKDNFKIKSAYYALGAIKFLENKNEESINYLKEALKYSNYIDIKDYEYELDIKIYSALSSNYIKLKKLEESESFFAQAKSIALKNNKENILGDLYYARAKSKVVAGYNINEAINLVRKSLEYITEEKNIVRNYLYLSTLYKLSSEFDLALEYTVNALEIAIELKSNELINSCVINLGETYYLQRKYSKTIDIYEEFIKSGRLENSNNMLSVYGYLVYCYGKKYDYTNYQIYKEKYLDLANEVNSIKDLIWLYSNCVELEIDFNNLELAKEYLNKAQNLYEQYSDETYANTDIVLEYAREKVDYFENKNYNNAIENYEIILEELNNRGIKSDITYAIINEILSISFEETDYETFIKYIAYLDDFNNSEESQVYTDSIFSKVISAIKEKEILKSKIRATILLIATVISICILISSIRKNKKINMLNSKLKELSIMDPLTKVYNRGYLNETLKSACENKKQVTFIMIDIDYFKLYNDNYGHINGDKALIEVAKIIKSVFENDMVFRYGGEEFSVISYKTIDELIKYLDELRLELYNKNIKHEYSEASDRITLSIGLASSILYTDNDLLELTKAADENLYKSKQQGRNRYTY
ncbi:GGDEF domain-containing protein [Clostridium cuniculi]|uniref:tetratricopeptide repeat-containing diguanylate cyclase n=1 Tax=Clostridium cuniculi TaxID=2548455 RepID=UPI001055FEA0|nr:GGDEF domain-containing protein [Clostridium cuniculi]